MGSGGRLEQMRPTGHGRARGLVSSRESGRRVDATSYRPEADLAPIVASLWSGAWDLREQDPHHTELLGDPCAHFVCEVGDRGDSCRLVGVWTRLWRRTLEGRGRVRGIKLRAGALRAVLPEPAHRYANRIVPLAELFPSETIEALHGAVMDPDDDTAGFVAFQTWLRARAKTDDEAIATAVELVETIVSDPSVTTVAALCDRTGDSPRGLQRLFRDYVGASPKWVIRRNRLQEVALRIEKGEAPSLAALAADLGYADQAHLARDFKAIVGKSPRQFAGSVG